MDYFGTLDENRIAYRKGHQTSDHLFTLNTLIQNAFNKSNSLYVCFVDFRKAFDSVPHSCLLNKLFVNGISGKFLKIITMLYSKVKSCARANDGLTEFFSCARGVRQGCILSPMLFALFLNDLNEKINSDSNGVRLGNETFSTLFYADDLVLLAESAEDLQNQLDTLHTYTSNIQMEFNVKKTKVMVLKRNKRKINNQSQWQLGSKDIKECNSYKYLGVTIK